MVLFVFACIVGLIGLLILIGTIRYKPRSSNDAPKWTIVVLGSGFLVVGLGMLFGDMFTTVPANSVGIVTAFGASHGTADAGPHLLAPWDSVTTYSTRVQVTSRLADPAKGDVAGADCVQTNLDGGASACVDVTVRYVVNKADAVTLWRNYGSFDTVRDVFLRTAVNNAVKIVYGQFTPQQVVNGAPLPQIAADLTKELSSQLGHSGLTLLTVSPGQVWLSAASQQRFDDVLNAQTDVQVAQQQLAKNLALAKANAALTQSLSTPVLVAQCIAAEQVVKAPVFNCFPGGSSATPLVSLNGR